MLAETIVQNALRKKEETINNNNDDNNNNNTKDVKPKETNNSNNFITNTKKNNSNNNLTPSKTNSSEVEKQNKKKEEDVPPVSMDFEVLSKVMAITTTATCKIFFHDFGGQDVFAAILNYFMTNDVIYLIVFSMLDLLSEDEKIREEGYEYIEKVSCFVVVVVVVVVKFMMVR